MQDESLAPDDNKLGEIRQPGKPLSFEELYEELKGIARNQLNRSVNSGTLSSTMLVNEAYLKLYHHDISHWNDKHHFYCVVARIVRQIITDYARKKITQKRSANEYDVECFMLSDSDPSIKELFDIDTAIEVISGKDAAMADLIQLRFYGGFTCEEIADMRHVSRSKVQRDWEIAREQLKKLVTEDRAC